VHFQPRILSDQETNAPRGKKSTVSGKKVLWINGHETTLTGFGSNFEVKMRAGSTTCSANFGNSLSSSNNPGMAYQVSAIMGIERRNWTRLYDYDFPITSHHARVGYPASMRGVNCVSHATLQVEPFVKSAPGTPAKGAVNNARKNRPIHTSFVSGKIGKKDIFTTSFSIRDRSCFTPFKYRPTAYKDRRNNYKSR
jgi:hypothetical protein